MLLGGTSAIADGPADDPDWVAPYLGLDPFAAEELQNDLQLEREGYDAAPVRHTTLPRSAPFWARLLPDLTLAVQYRVARQRLLASASGHQVLRRYLRRAAGWWRAADSPRSLIRMPRQRHCAPTPQRASPNIASLSCTSSAM